MNIPSLNAILDDATSLQITWVIVHFLWQGLAVSAFVFISNLFAARRSPKLRYGVAVAGVVAMVVGVVTTWCVVQPSPSTIDPAMGVVSFDGDMTLGIDPTFASMELEVSAESKTLLEIWAPAATAIYVVGVALMLFRLAFSAIGIGRLRYISLQAGDELVARVEALSQQIGLRLKPALKSCERVVVPFVAGVVKPAILLPSAVASGLTHAELDAILLHELAHIRRCDLLVNFLQRIAESLLFFHPAVWYVSRVITVERENCCDDVVLGQCSQKVYASALIRLAEACADDSSDVAPIVVLAATGATPSQLKRRVLRILGMKPVRQFNKPGFGVLFACIVAVTVSVMHLQAQAGNNDDGTKQTEDSTQFQPLTISFGQDGKIAGFVLNDSGADSMSRFTAILQELTARKGIISSTNITRTGERMTMSVFGKNLDLSTIQSSVNFDLGLSFDSANDEAEAARAEANVQLLEQNLIADSLAKSNEDLKRRLRKKEAELEALHERNEVHRELLRLRIQEAALAEKYGSDHPRRKTLKKQILSLEKTHSGKLRNREDFAAPKSDENATVTPAGKEMEITGPIKFELYGDDAFVIKGDKADVDRVMRVVETIRRRDRENGKSDKKVMEVKDRKAKPRKITGPVRFEFIEGTDIFVVRGTKEDVDTAMSLIQHTNANKNGSTNDPDAVADEMELKDQLDKSEERQKNHVFNLRFVAPSEVRSVIQGIISDDSIELIPDGKQNRLFVRANDQQIEMVQKMLKQIDIERQKKKFRAFRVGNGDAAVVAETVKRMMGGALEIVVDESGNVVYVNAFDAELKQIQELISQIAPDRIEEPSKPKRETGEGDQPKGTKRPSKDSGAATSPGEAGKTQTERFSLATFDLEHVEPEQLVKALEKAYGSDLQGNKIAFKADASGEAILVSAPQKELERIRQILMDIERLASTEKTIGTSANRRIFPLKFVDAKAFSGALNKSMGSVAKTVHIGCDAPTNSLLVRAPAREMKQLASVIEGMDKVDGTLHIGILARLLGKDQMHVMSKLNTPLIRDPLSGALRKEMGLLSIDQKENGSTKSPLRFPEDVEKAMMIDAIEPSIIKIR